MTEEPSAGDQCRRAELRGVGVVVVAYKSASTIRDCMESICADPTVGLVVIVDNSSDRHTRRIVELAAQNDPRVKYLDPGRNVGFAAGCNIGAAHCGAVEWMAFVNPDVVLKRGIGELIDAAAGSAFSIVAGGLAATNGSIVNARRQVTLVGELRKALAGSSHYVVSSLREHDRLLPVAQVDGAFMLMRAEVLARLEGFDESFELYYEDVDLCRRAREIAPVLLAVGVWGVHAAGSSYRQSSERAFVALRVSRVRYLRKACGSSIMLSAAIAVIAVFEFLVRIVLRPSDGARTRVAALIAQYREIRSPGSVRVLR